jgi:hypothetical protein
LEILVDRKFSPLSPQQCVGEAARLARSLIEYQWRPGGLNMVAAIESVEAIAAVRTSHDFVI